MSLAMVPQLPACVPVFRFAPSPNGHLHLGHVRSALIGSRLAANNNGRFLVRMEDIDTARCRSEFISSILSDLAWLGVAWETPVRQQSQHFDTYRAAAGRLLSAGLLYPCYASRAEIAAAADLGRTDPDGVPLYPGARSCLSSHETARRAQRGAPFALRLDMERALAEAHARLNGKPLTFIELDVEQGQDISGISSGVPTPGLKQLSLSKQGRVIEARPERWGDAVIVRRDTPTSYHLSVVVDDALQRITHVTRGRDLYAATDLHRLLQVLLGLPAPQYHHHTVIVGPDGRKLSKSRNAASLQSLRAAGLSVQDIYVACGL
jgi:glutamyl-Q tRNA(Asp) synthetase